MSEQEAAAGWKLITGVAGSIVAFIAAVFGYIVHRRKTNAEAASITAGTQRADDLHRLEISRQSQEGMDRAAVQIVKLLDHVRELSDRVSRLSDELEALDDEKDRCKDEAKRMIRELRERGYDSTHLDELEARAKMIHGG